FPPGPRLPAEELTKLKDRASALFKEALGPDGIRERDATVRDRAAAILALKDLGPPRQIAYVGAVHKGNGNFIGTGNAGGKPRPIHILPRGDVTKPGKEVGRGLVETPNDFGKMGQLPTHPELLDWLAAELRDNGMSLKKLHRLIVTSDTYKQASNAEFGMRSAEYKRLFGIPIPHSAFRNRNLVDEDNRFLWRQNRRKLEAEAV